MKFRFFLHLRVSIETSYFIIYRETQKVEPHLAPLVDNTKYYHLHNQRLMKSINALITWAVAAVKDSFLITLYKQGQ